MEILKSLGRAVAGALGHHAIKGCGQFIVFIFTASLRRNGELALVVAFEEMQHSLESIGQSEIVRIGCLRAITIPVYFFVNGGDKRVKGRAAIISRTAPRKACLFAAT